VFSVCPSYRYASVNGDPKYKSYRNCRRLKKPVEDLLKASCIDLSNGGVLKNLQFQAYIQTKKLLCSMV
jgi:hypothetical protein